MDPKHARSFEEHLVEVCELYERNPPSRAALRIWWEALKDYPWDLVRAALNRHCASCKFPPRPADVVALLIEQDGRPSADEAWAVAVTAQDESATVVWTEEIVAAWAIARPILDQGDAIGARRTFIAAYERETASARARLKPAVWSASLGTNAEGRVPALAASVRQGRLTKDAARALVGPQAPSTPESAEAAIVAGLITGKIARLPKVETANASRFLEAVRKGIDGARDHAEQARAAAEIERYAARERAAAHKQAELERLSSFGTTTASTPTGAA